VSRACFLDNDIIQKLVALNLFYEAIDCLQVDRTSLRVLPTAPFWFSRQKRKAQRYSDVIWDAGIAVVNACEPIHVELDDDCQDEIAFLEQFRNEIHEGERTLILSTRSEVDFLFLTGDKVCIRALSMMPETICQRLEGKIVCFEQVILLLIRQRGFETIKQQVLPMLDCDTGLRACFGSGERAIEENVVLALEGYIEDLERSTIGLLADLSQF
jgi:hypothetical protein